MRAISIRRHTMARGFCPECDSSINLGNNPTKNQKVTCQSCGAYLEVVAISPIELDWAFDDDFDYDDDFEDDEDY
jgi:lysine biosynthesis protein LysW